MKHALLSPSSSHRWLPCPGSVAQSKNEPNPPNDYTDEGTAAHHLAAEALIHGVNATAFRTLFIGLWGGAVGDDSECYEKMFYPPPGPEPSPSPRARFLIDDEMCGHVQKYLDDVRRYAEGKELLVEQRLSIAHVTGEEDAAGTSDAVILDFAQEELQIHDLKYGQGHRVEAKENSQLKIYGASAVEEYKDIANFKRVRFVIHQPRLDHLSEWDCSVEELLAWVESIKPIAKKALALYNDPHDPEYEGAIKLCAGDHCRNAFCPARASCPAFDDYVIESVGAHFDDLTGIQQEVKALKREDLPYDLVTLGNKLKAVANIESWCTAVRAKVESVLLAAHNDEATIETLGFKLVQGRKGHRDWRDAVEVETKLKAMRLKQDEMYSKSLLSPTGIEKVLKDRPAKWEALIPFIVQKEGKPSVEVKTDKRPPLVITPVIDSFDNLEEVDTGGLV